MTPWIDVGPADLTEGELRGLEIGERLVLLSCLEGEISAMDDSCNHAGCLLSGGWMNERKRAVVCPCHEFMFELKSGRNVTLVDGPKLHRLLQQARAGTDPSSASAAVVLSAQPHSAAAMQAASGPLRSRCMGAARTAPAALFDAGRMRCRIPLAEDGLQVRWG